MGMKSRSIPRRFPETVENSIVGTQRKGKNDNGLFDGIPLPRCVDLEWIATVRSNHHQLEKMSLALHTGLPNIHPTAYLLKALAMGLKQHRVIEEYNEAVIAIGVDLKRLSDIMQKRAHQPKHRSSEIWKRRSKAKLSESKILMVSIKVLNQLIMLDLITNYRIFNARVCSEQIEVDTSNSFPRSSSSTDRREKNIDTSIEAYKENRESTKNLRDQLEQSNDVTKKIILENYSCCSSCETMYNNEFLSLFGRVQNVCDDSPFLCFQCDDFTAKTQIKSFTEDRSLTNSSSDSNKKSRRKKNNKNNKKKRNKPPVEIVAIGSNDYNKNKEEHNNAPKSPTSVASLHVLDPQMDSLELPQVLDQANNLKDSCNVTSQPIDDVEPTEVSNEDLVDFLMQSGSILALDKFMNEMGFDDPAEDLKQSEMHTTMS